MGMVVRTNTMALNAYRQLGMNNSAVSKSLEKLSSGFRINRAGDDAAGLAISEKMKAQITGLETASANAQDGISLIQTAEGNLNEVHDMLNRMVELATKSANGTYTQTERDALQAEVDQLLEEIDRISKSANFNGANLLDGSLEKGADLTVRDLTLPGVGDELGVNTVLHKEPSSVTTGSTFGVYVSNLAWSPATTGDKLTFRIGKNEYSISASATDVMDGVKANAIMTSLVAELDGKTFVDDNGNEFTFTSDSAVAKTDATKIFLKASSGTGTLTFTQMKRPTGEDNVLTTPKAIAFNVSGGTFGELGTSDSKKFSVAGQDYNVASINQLQVGLEGGPRLATTYFKLTSNMVQDGASIKLGKETYKFTTDEAGKTATGNVYIGDLDMNTEEGLNQAMIRLTAAAGGSKGGIGAMSSADENTYFKVGYDGNRITIEEKPGVITYNSTTGKLDENNTTNTEKYDFRTLEGLKKALGFNGVTKTGTGLVLQIGDTADNFNKMTVSVADMSSKGLKLNGLSIRSESDASSAIDKIKTAINTVSSARAGMGALQNRLEHTINNLDVAVENLSAANSRIRDTDMAKEMMNYTKMNVLVQSAQAMLAQANQQPQSVLQLLQ